MNDQSAVLSAALFPGQGAYDMAALSRAHALYPQVGRVFSEIDEVAQEEDSQSLSQLLFGPAPISVAELLADKPWRSQLTIYGANLAAYYVLHDMGFDPEVLVGHSMGEVAALVCAGAYSIADGARIAVRRVQVLVDLDIADTYMLALSASAERAQQIIDLLDDPIVTVAAENHADQTIIAGPSKSLDLLSKVVEPLGIPTTRLESLYPFHSPLLEPAIPQFTQKIRDIPQKTLTKRVFSPILQRYYEPDEPLSELFAQHFTHPVRFNHAVSQLCDEKIRVFVECGAQNTLTKFVTKIAPPENVLALATFTSVGEHQLQLDTAIDMLRVWGVLTDIDEQKLIQVSDNVGADGFANFWTMRGPRIMNLIRQEFVDFYQETPSKAAKVTEIEIEKSSIELSRESVAKEIKEIYAKELDYPLEVILEDIQLEAELGIDSLKKMALLGAIMKHYGLENPPDFFRLNDYKTLGPLIDFIYAVLTGAKSEEAVALTNSHKS